MSDPERKVRTTINNRTFLDPWYFNQWKRLLYTFEEFMIISYFLQTYCQTSNIKYIFPSGNNMWCPWWVSNISTSWSTPLLMDAVCVLSISYATYNINVVSLTLVCNKHLSYTICYSLISERNWDFPSRIITY